MSRKLASFKSSSCALGIKVDPENLLKIRGKKKKTKQKRTRFQLYNLCTHSRLHVLLLGLQGKL